MKLIGTRDELIQEILKLEYEKIYSLEIKEYKSKRTLQQNKYMWALIREIARVQLQDEMEIYISALEDANAKYTYIMGLEDIQDELCKNFRAVKVVRPEYVHNKKFIVYKCFIGSSKFDKEEMAKLLDIVINYAEELNINTNIYEPKWGA